MRAVLLLAYNYPPNGNMAAQRTAGFAKYLPDYGWQPLVITGDWTKGNCRNFDPNCSEDVHEAAVIARGPVIPQLDSVSFVTRFWRRAQPLVSGARYPSRWTDSAIRATRSLCREHGLDAIWASFGPAGPLYCADRIHREFGIPWLADFRDIWEHASRRFWWWHARREVAVCRSAAAITSVSPALVRQLRARHGRRVILIPNGYDPDSFQGEVVARSPTFDIVYTGNVPRHLRDPTMLFQALDLLAHRSRIDLSKISIVFYGSRHSSLSGLGGYVSFSRAKVVPWVPRSEANLAQRSATVLLHLSTPHLKGIMTGKIFEYLAAKRPIITIPGDRDCVDKLLRLTRAGVSLGQPEAIATQLLEWYSKWEKTGTLHWSGDENEIARYSRKSQAGGLAALLDRIALGETLV